MDAQIMMDIAGYQVRERIGKGGMATVYLACREGKGDPVALKLIDLAHLPDPSWKTRFIQEKKIIAQLNHPNIVRLYDAGAEGHYLYMVMELLEDDLKTRAQRGLRVSQALNIIEQVASGLAYAHDRGYLHRDVKPENILFRQDGAAVLTDFGLARARFDAPTDNLASVGTPRYMSPEQARGRALEPASDIYSLGIVLYELLTGRVPFRAEDSITLGIMHLQEPVPPLPEPLSGLQPLLNKMLAKNPGERFHSAYAVMDEIDRLRQKLSLDQLAGDYIAEAAPLGHEPRRLGGMRRPYVVLGSAVGAVLAASMAVAFVALKHPGPVEGAPAVLPETLSRSQQEDIQALLAAASEALARGHLVMPEGASALSLYRSVSNRHPGHPQVDAGMQQLHRQLQHRAEQHLLAGEPAQAKAALVDMVRAAAPARQVNDLRATINEQLRVEDARHLAGLDIRQRLMLNGLLVNAQIDIEDGRLVAPADQNARARYQQALAIDPDNVEARQGMYEVAALLIQQAGKALDQRHLADAQAALSQAQTTWPAHPHLPMVQAHLDELGQAFSDADNAATVERPLQ